MKITLFLFPLFVIIYSSFFILAPTAHAQFQSAGQGTNYLNTNPDVPQNLNTYTQSVFINIATTFVCIFTGVDPLNPRGECLGIDPATNKIGYVKQGGGLMAITGNLIASTFYIPVSTHDYGSYMASNFGIGEKAYAQSLGFNGLKPTLSLWQAFRNITYIIFVVLFIIVGLGIMFRIKIDPRTVMTVQNQIPKIIIAIILITFSYAIAGFLIDLMYVSMYLIISVFVGQGLDVVDVSSSTPFGAAGGLGGLGGIANAGAHTIGGVVRSIFDGTLGAVLGGIIGSIIGAGAGAGGIGGAITRAAGIVGKTGGIPGAIIGIGVGLGVGMLSGAIAGGHVAGFAAGVIAYIIIIIALFSALLRLWFILIKSYIFILINVVFAPFLIAKGLIPGQPGIGGWTRSMVSNLSVFPVTITMFLLGKTFIDGFEKHPNPFAPPMVGDFSNPAGFAPIIGLGIILMLPEVANMVRDALKQPDFKYAASIGKSLGVGAGAPGRLISGGTSAAFGSHIQYEEDPKNPGAMRIAKAGPLTRLARGFGIVR